MPAAKLAAGSCHHSLGAVAKGGRLRSAALLDRRGWGLVKIMRYWFPSVVPVVRHALAWRLGQAPFDPAPQHFEVRTLAFDRFRLISFNKLACFI